MVRVVATMVEKREEAEARGTRNGDERGDEREGHEKCKGRSERPADSALAHNRSKRFFPRAGLAAPRIELVEDRLPLAADSFLPQVEVIERLGGGLDLPRDLHLGRSEFFEAFPHCAPQERL